MNSIANQNNKAINKNNPKDDWIYPDNIYPCDMKPGICPYGEVIPCGQCKPL